MGITNAELRRAFMTLVALGASYWLKLDWLAAGTLVYCLCSAYLTLEADLYGE